jgi:hypothetical protein
MGSFNVAQLEALLSAGVPPERARAVVDLFDRSVEERCSLHGQVLATRRDVAELETRLSRDIAELETRLSGDIAAVAPRAVGARTRVAAPVALAALLVRGLVDAPLVRDAHRDEARGRAWRGAGLRRTGLTPGRLAEYC